MTGQLTFGVAIPAYRDVEALRKCLTSVRDVSPTLLERTTITDDSGSGNVSSVLHTEFPSVHWIIHDHNCGFGSSANDAVMACDVDVVILLNDDVELIADPVLELRSLFADSSLFAVTFQSRHADGSFREGAKRIIWPLGMPRVLHNPRDQSPPVNGLAPSAYAVGGHAAFHREKFLVLGGFDPLFEPFYWEDVDLSTRAREHGWPTVYSAVCIVKHDGPSAIRSSNETQTIREIALRNRLLFAWRHLHGPLRLVHHWSLGYSLLASLFSRRHTFFRAWLAARSRWGQYSKFATIELNSTSKGVHVGQ